MKVFPATYSWAELEKFSDLIVQYMIKTNIQFVDIGPDAELDAVLVHTGPQSDALSDGLASVVPLDSFTIDTSGGSWVAANGAPSV